jgi:solute:Na+ symporter, SSS family
LVVLFQQINQSPFELISNVFNSPKSDIWDWEWKSSNNFFKQFFSGIFIAIALNGLDQDIVQKNLTCRDGRTARKNMMWFSLLFVITVFLFFFLGQLFIVCQCQTDSNSGKDRSIIPFHRIKPSGHYGAGSICSWCYCSSLLQCRLGHNSPYYGILLRLSRCWPYELPTEKAEHNGGAFAFFVVLYGIIMMFYQMHDQSVVVTIFKAAGYTYGPILGIFLFSFFVTQRRFPRFVLLSFILSPALTYLCEWATNTYTDYRFGFELIILNAFITLVLLTLFSKRWK